MNDRMMEEGRARHLGLTRRRMLVVAFYLCMTVFAGALGFGGDRWWVLPALGLLILAFAIHFRLIRPIALEVMKGDISKLDERQISVRDRAHYHAYQILVVAFMSVLFYAWLATGFGAPYLPMPGMSQHFAGLLFLSVQLVASLPASVVAWIEPDPRPDEED